MSQLRQDPLTGRWVILAHGRSARPNEFPLQRGGGSQPAECPFCPGNESRTTAEITALGRPSAGAPNSPGWSLRVVPNKYPALAASGAAPGVGPAEEGPQPAGLFRHEAGIGAHEVIVYSADHDSHLATLPDDEIADLLGVLRDRYVELSREPRHRYVLSFLNHGAEAGATLSHPHLQILAGPVVPDTVRSKLKRMREHREHTGRCLVCDLAAAEEGDGARLVEAADHWLAVTPWASRFAWEMLLIPRRHHGGPQETGPAELRDLAGLLGRVLRRLDRIHGNPALNLVLHAEPTAERGSGIFHWHLEICPRLARLAGFEAGTGFAINSVAPEEAAARLREGSE